MGVQPHLVRHQLCQHDGSVLVVWLILQESRGMRLAGINLVGAGSTRQQGHGQLCNMCNCEWLYQVTAAPAHWPGPASPVPAAPRHAWGGVTGRPCTPPLPVQWHSRVARGPGSTHTRTCPHTHTHLVQLPPLAIKLCQVKTDARCLDCCGDNSWVRFPRPQTEPRHCRTRNESENLHLGKRIGNTQSLCVIGDSAICVDLRSR